MVDNDTPGAWPVWTPGAPLAAFIKENIIHWSTQYMKALGHMVSQKKIFLCFSHDAHVAGPVWTPGAQLAEFIAGFIKRTTILTGDRHQARHFYLAKQFCFLDADSLVVEESQGSSRGSVGKYPVKPPRPEGDSQTIGTYRCRNH